jgi:signal peptidase II
LAGPQARLSIGRLAFAIVAVVVFVLDRITKTIVGANVQYGQERSAIDHLVWITNVHNAGAAFGTAPALATLFLIASMVVSVGLVVYVWRQPDDPQVNIVLGMILGGTLGNGFDRIIFGTVTDFIDVRFWPIFNVADSAISVAVALLIAGYLLRKPAAA